MNPYAVDVDRVRTAPADSASLCCALKSEQVVVPPEGGVAVEDPVSGVPRRRLPHGWRGSVDATRFAATRPIFVTRPGGSSRARRP